ncbi:MAG TPA: glycosyltransferase family 39 protein, partial [Cyclobacteriaceae bacterium]|nr:glycosyltransferase family 39 protein [Cyclobacteriaceae bacterium]
STYRLGARIYSKRVGALGSLILATAYGFFLANNDVRMDALLTGAIIFSVWQLVIFMDEKKYAALLLSALGLAMGFATKGLIGVAMPAIASFFYVAQRGDWKDLRDPRWLLLLFAFSLFVAPVFYCFYVQFDLHPEKIIRGTTGNSGIAFLLFGQSLQRYGGSGWGSSGNGDPFFYLHTLLWAFLPWSLLVFIAIWQAIKNHVRSKFTYGLRNPLFIPATILIMLILLSGSHFKLPHYLDILFPFLALCTAGFIVSTKSKWKKKIAVIQYVTSSIVIILALILNFWSFPLSQPHTLLVSILLMMLLMFFIVFHRKQYLTITLISTALLYYNLNFNFFPKLLQLQAGNVLAAEIRNERIPEDQVRYLEGYETSNSFDFHVGKIIPGISIPFLKQSNKPWTIYTGPSGYEALASEGIRFQVLQSAVSLKVSVIDLSILDPAKRKNEPRHYLLRVN